jgi:outer membrane autotransporter protein
MRAWVGLAVTLALAAGGAAQAQTPGNAPVRTFFVTACPSATGVLVALCAQSRGGVISTDSQSSLTPNQAAVAGTNALARAQALAALTEARLESVREEGGDAPVARGVSLFATYQSEDLEQYRAAFANERAFEGRTWRFTAGGDFRPTAETILGLSLTYSDDESDFDANPAGRNFTPLANAGGSDVTEIDITAYGSMALADRLTLEGSLGVGFSDQDFRRNGSYQESNRTLQQVDIRATGSADGRRYAGSLGLAYDVDAGPVSFGPYARLRWNRASVDGYTEADAANTGLALRISKSRATSLVSVLGARASYAISLPWGVVVPQARAEWEHEFKDDPRTITTSLALAPNGGVFQVRTDTPDRNAWNLGAGVLVILPNGWMPYLDFEVLDGYSDLRRERISAGLRVEF